MADYNELTIELGKVLDEYEKELDENVNVAMHAVAKEAATKLKAESPKTTGEYARGWKVKNDFDSKTYTVYNATKPGLTHLLENGHLARNQFGTWGRVSGKKHIEPVEEWAKAEVMRRIEQRLNNVE